MRIDGWAVGIVANQRKAVKPKGEMQFGGVIYSDSADKATRFICNCNQKKSLSFCSGCYRFYGGI
jgi:acetyl-CoA carboxylase carboxyltransferase component